MVTDLSNLTQEDFIFNQGELWTDAEIKVYLSHIHISKHEYLHDPKFKTSNWNIIVYPSKEWCDSHGIEYDGSSGYGSAPDDWIQQMINYFMVPFCVSPLHDKDVNPTGQIKKPHWHVTISLDGPQNWYLFFKRTQWLHCAVPVDCGSLAGSIKYMAHLNNPEKYQYDPDMITGYCGFKVEEALQEFSAAEQRQFIKEMIRFCIDQEVSSYSDFLSYAMDYRSGDWFPCLIRNSSMVKDVIKENEKKLKGV